MKVILQEEIKKVGKKGDIIEVAEGYARNFLLPRKLAVPATEVNISNVNQQKASAARKQQQAADEARVLASQISKVSVTVSVKTGEGGKLFGSITAKDIAEALAAQGIELDKKKIELKEAIKALGVYSVTVRIHPETTAQIQVHVVGA